MLRLLAILFLGTLLSASLSATAIGPEFVELANDQLTVRIARRGAELQGIRDRQTGREFLWQGDPAHWAGRAPLMFPVIVRFKDLAFTHQGKKFETPHLGLLPNYDFKVQGTGPASVTLRLTSDASTLNHYPFPFTFDLTYTLEGRRLVHRFEIRNNGNETMFFTLGGHPGFALPTTGGKTRADYEITFSRPLTTDRPIVADGLIQAKRVPFLQAESRLSLADARVPDHGMVLIGHGAARIGIAEKGGAPFLELEAGDFPNANLWTPPGKPFVCIEPLWTHHESWDAPPELSAKPNLRPLAPGKSESLSFTIIVR